MYALYVAVKQENIIANYMRILNRVLKCEFHNFQSNIIFAFVYRKIVHDSHPFQVILYTTYVCVMLFRLCIKSNR